jgi:hypothetical protein
MISGLRWRVWQQPRRAQYILRSLPEVQSVSSWQEVHSLALQHVTIKDGLVLEFGVFQARTINFIAGHAPWTVHGFDSFEGLPESWRDGFGKGAFSIATLPEVRANVVLHKGWFDEQIPVFLESQPKPFVISYLHVDCDLYSSTKTIFDLLGDYIVEGTVIVFDEYFNYPGWQMGEFKAFQEFIAGRNLTYQYITYHRQHEQVAVRICAKAAS